MSEMEMIVDVTDEECRVWLIYGRNLATAAMGELKLEWMHHCINA